MTSLWFSQEDTWYTKKSYGILKYQFVCSYIVNLNFDMRYFEFARWDLHAFFYTCSSSGALSWISKLKIWCLPPPPPLLALSSVNDHNYNIINVINKQHVPMSEFRNMQKYWSNLINYRSPSLTASNEHPSTSSNLLNRPPPLQPALLSCVPVISPLLRKS